jgi:hypothetical protein
MKRWSKRKRADHENVAIDQFIEDVIRVCKKHGYSIEHEDAHGAFEVVPFNDDASEWLRAAADAT